MRDEYTLRLNLTNDEWRAGAAFLRGVLRANDPRLYQFLVTPELSTVLESLPAVLDAWTELVAA